MFLFISVLVLGKEWCLNSNTSYVLVYLTSIIRIILERHIQIHLMFLFITLSGVKITGDLLFKYILCSCLSTTCLFLIRILLYSNTSYVLVYPGGKGPVSCNRKIQIHLMFLFIVVSSNVLPVSFSFKYILCSCLSHGQWPE